PPGCIDPLCGFANTGILPPPGSTSQPLFLAELLASLSSPVLVINNLTGQGPTQFAALNPAGPSLFNTVEGGIRLPPQRSSPSAPGGAPGGQQQLPSGFDRRVIDIPPPTETRFVKDEVVVQIATTISLERLRAAVAPLGLEVLASENLAIIGS